MPHDLHDPVYPVGSSTWSIFDLLRRFGLPENQLDGIARMSDLHLKVGEPACYRFDNEIDPLPQGARLTADIIERLVLPLLHESQRRALRADAPTDVDAGFELPGESLSFRINVFRDREGLAAAIRALPSAIPEVTRIGFPDDAIWKEIVELRQGLVIVTGITGSGKSTTVASLLQHVNRTRRARILTLEDPIEYVLRSERSLVSQRELRTHVPSFPDGLRSALREDPDILFVGEMRDRDTAALALTAAETGHLVLSTLHTRDARGAIARIVDMFPAERGNELACQLSFSLSYVLAQKLVPLRSGGRRAAMEVLKNIPSVSNLIRTAKWHLLYGAMETNRRDGLLPLERHLEELVKTEQVAREDALRYANLPGLLS